MFKRFLLFLAAIIFVFSCFLLVANKQEKALAVDPEIDLWSIYIADPSKVTTNVNPGQAPNVIDGNDLTSWSCPTAGDWWKMDLGATYQISKVGVYMSGGHVYSYYSNNDINWTLITSTSGLYQEYPYAPSISARYFRFVADADYAWNTARTLRLWGTGGGSSTPPPTPTPSNSSGGPTPTPSGTGTSGPPTPTTTIIDGTELPYNPTNPTQPQTENFNIKLEIPNGGEEWWFGKTYEIKWKSTDNEKKISSIGLFLSTDGGKNYKYLIAKDLSNDGDNSWQIPFDESLATDEARALVAAISSDNQVLINDASDNNFRIRSPKTEFLSVTNNNLFLIIIALILLLLAAGAVLWPLVLNFILNSFITSFLNRLSLLTAPTMGNKKGMGIVYDSYTKSPVAGAVIRVFSAADNRLRQTIICNKKGEFNFLLPRGNYYLQVSATQYDFPSLNLLKKIKPASFQATTIPPRKKQFTPGLKDNGYLNIYFGEIISLNNQGDPSQRSALNINIPLDKSGTLNAEGKVLHILRWIGSLLAKLKWPSLILGVIVSVISIWSDFNILNVVILNLFIILVLYEIYRLTAKSRPFGLVFDQEKKAVELALVRFKGKNDKIKSTAISGRDGKFVAQVNPGNYQLLTKKNGYKEDTRNVSLKSVRRLEKLNICLRAN